MFKRIADRNIWVIYAAIVLLGVAYGTSIAVLAIHLDKNGIPKLEMGGLAAAFALGIAAFAIPAGILVRRIGAKKTLLFALLGYAVCVASFPFLKTLPALAAARFFDGAFSANVWVAAETALLARSSRTNKAFVMSLYAVSLALGYVLGPLLARGLVGATGTPGTFVASGVLGVVAAVVVATQLEDAKLVTHEEDDEAADGAAKVSSFLVFWRTKTSCFATFSYGYFQASVVLYLPLFLIKKKGVSEEQTILVTAFFAAGMLVMSTWVSRIGDRVGHLLVMRALALIGGTMVASFVFLPAFWMMCVAVFVAGATLASISPVSLALSGVVTPKRDLDRANGFYNASYAAGMLVGPPIAGALFDKVGGGAMLFQLAGLWGCFVLFTIVFANDDPARRAPAGATSSASIEA